LDFFTPTKQIAHCGHATIATFVYLRELGLITKTESSKETIDGKREIYFDDDMAFMEQLAPSYKEVNHCIENFRGPIFQPGDDGYDEARMIYNAINDLKTPACHRTLHKCRRCHYSRKIWTC
jgi:hypothetical protein